MNVVLCFAVIGAVVMYIARCVMKSNLEEIAAKERMHALEMETRGKTK